MNETTTNGWNEWSKYVLKMLDRLETNQDALAKKQDQFTKDLENATKDLLVEIAKLKTAAAIRGAVSGVVGSGGVFLIIWIITQLVNLR